MLQWINDNLATIIVSGILLITVGLIIVKMVKDKKNGKSGCGCGCGGCAMKDQCHSNKK